MVMGREIIGIFVTADVRNAIRNLDALGDAASRMEAKASTDADRTNASMLRLGAGLTAAAAAGTLGLFKLGQGAAELEVSIASTEAIFGSAAAQIQDFADTSAQAFGISTNAALQFGARIGAQLKSFGLSTDQAADTTERLLGLGADLSATFGGPVSEAIYAIAAVLRGERDPIERFGVSLKQVDIDAQVAAKGLDTSTAASKKQSEALAALDLLFGQTAASQGQFGRLQGTAAVQQKVLAAEFDNLKRSIGEGVLPVLTLLTGGTADLVGALDHLPDSVKKGAGAFATFATAGIGLQGAVLLSIVGIRKMRTSLAEMAATAPLAASALGVVSKAAIGLGVLAGAVALIDALHGETRATAEELTDLANAMRDVAAAGNVTDVLGDFGGDLRTFEHDVNRVFDKLEDQSGWEAFSEGMDNFASSVKRADSGLDIASNKIDNIDKALALLAATNGPAAARMFELLTAGLRESGKSTDDLERIFDDYFRAADTAAGVTGDFASEADLAKAAADNLGAGIAALSGDMSGLRNAAGSAAEGLAILQAAQQTQREMRDDVIGLFDALEDLDTIQDEVTQGASGGAAATKTWSAQVVEATQKQFAYRDALIGVERATMAVGDAQREYGDSVDELTGAIGEVESAQEHARRITEGYGAGARETRDALNELGDATRDVRSAKLDVSDAKDNLAELRAEAEELPELLADAQRELDEARSSSDVREAQQELLKTITDPFATDDEKARAREKLEDAQKKRTDAIAQAEDNLAKVRKRQETIGRDVERAELRLEDARDAVQAATERAKEAERVYQGYLEGFPATSDEAKDAQERLKDATDAAEQAYLRARDAGLALRDATNQVDDANLELFRSTEDLEGRLDSAAGGAGRFAKKQRDLRDATINVRDRLSDLAWEIVNNTVPANADAKTKTDAYIRALLGLQALLPAGSPLRTEMQEWIDQWRDLRDVMRDIEDSPGLFGLFDWLRERWGIDAPDRPDLSGLPQEHGGPVRSGTGYLVGEKRPELFVGASGARMIVGMGGPDMFVPPEDGRILPNVPLDVREHGGVVRGRGLRYPAPVTVASDETSGTTNIVINVSSLDPGESATLVYRALKQYEADNGPIPLRTR